METLGLGSESESESEIEVEVQPSPDTAYTGFWKRQFCGAATSKQRVFDWVFGVIMPVVCFALDPGIFKGEGLGPILGSIKPFAYVLSYTSIMAMIAWLLFGSRLKWFSVLIAGLFAAGGLISLMVGTFLLPFSLIGLVFLIGFLGFTPLFTFGVYTRNAVRAFRAARPFIEQRTLISGVLIAALYSLVVPAVINVEISRYIDEIRLGDPAKINSAAAKLKYVNFLVDPAPVARKYHQVSDSEERRKAIASAYETLSGKSIKSVPGFLD